MVQVASFTCTNSVVASADPRSPHSLETCGSRDLTDNSLER